MFSSLVNDGTQASAESLGSILDMVPSQFPKSLREMSLREVPM